MLYASSESNVSQRVVHLSRCKPFKPEKYAVSFSPITSSLITEVSALIHRTLELLVEPPFLPVCKKATGLDPLLWLSCGGGR